MKPPTNNNNKPIHNLNKWLAYSSMGLEMFGIIGVFTAGGYFLDKKLNTSPIFLIILLLISVSGSFYRIYKQTIK